MALVGNLVLSGSKVVYRQRLHHMPEYIEWLLGVMYSVGGKTPEEYAQQESLLWECILLGLAFPYSIGINRVNFLLVDNSSFSTICILLATQCLDNLRGHCQSPRPVVSGFRGNSISIKTPLLNPKFLLTISFITS
ncbi:hypothetical protein DSO57_1036102 [Entomophthora muscae]|uniref:Uncharacterized protein n=1 Tax=Entomophthora muscae TaxID=34485 RepID=A0ACC2RQ89_9FUNG|nr:hypothetical protein DSO57_1036102 [Entomophthora muscae]